MSRTKSLKNRWTRFVKVKANTPESVKCFQNSLYMVFVRQMEVAGFGDGYHLSIKRNDREAMHDWRHLQRIKNEILGTDMEAVELYPAESRLVDGANQYHLWCFPNFNFDFGFRERMVVLPEHTAPDAKQRPFDVPVADTFIPQFK